MENQIDLESQNMTQLGSDQVSQPLTKPKNPQINYLLIAGIVVVCFILFAFGGYYLGKQSNNTAQMQQIETNTIKDQQSTQIKLHQPTINPSPSPVNTSIVTNQEVTPQESNYPTVNSSPTPAYSNLNTFTAKNFTVKIPPTWQMDKTYYDNQGYEEVRFYTTRPTTKQAGGDFTPGFADIVFRTGPDLDTDFWQSNSNSATQVEVDNQIGEQRSGYTGVAGTVFLY